MYISIWNWWMHGRWHHYHLDKFPPSPGVHLRRRLPKRFEGGRPSYLVTGIVKWDAMLSMQIYANLCTSMQIYANLCKSYWSFVSGAEIPPKKPECLGLVSYNDPLLLAIHHNVYQFLSSKTWRKTHRIPIHFWENETKRYFKPQAQIVPIMNCKRRYMKGKPSIYS